MGIMLSNAASDCFKSVSHIRGWREGGIQKVWKLSSYFYRAILEDTVIQYIFRILACMCNLSIVCYMPCPSDPPLFDHNNI
jgi:hypothetical protein